MPARVYVCEDEELEISGHSKRMYMRENSLFEGAKTGFGERISRILYPISRPPRPLAGRKVPDISTFQGGCSRLVPKCLPNESDFACTYTLCVRVSKGGVHPLSPFGFPADLTPRLLHNSHHFWKLCLQFTTLFLKSSKEHLICLTKRHHHPQIPTLT